MALHTYVITYLGYMIRGGGGGGVEGGVAFIPSP